MKHDFVSSSNFVNHTFKHAMTGDMGSLKLSQDDRKVERIIQQIDNIYRCSITIDDVVFSIEPCINWKENDNDLDCNDDDITYAVRCMGYRLDKSSYTFEEAYIFLQDYIECLYYWLKHTSNALLEDEIERRVRKISPLLGTDNFKTDNKE